MVEFFLCPLASKQCSPEAKTTICDFSTIKILGDSVSVGRTENELKNVQ